MKTFNGKSIYNPSGKAGEYSYWACNFYNGCSNGCTYCYLRKGVLAHVCGGDTPTLKKCFKDEAHAQEIFEKEFRKNLPELQKHGLFFSFTTDPFLPETNQLTRLAMRKCLAGNVPVKILTKRADWVDKFLTAPDYYISGWDDWAISDKKIHNVAFGFTLTGHDELEPNAAPNAERINAMKKLHNAGFKTWASIEPIVDFGSSITMVKLTRDFCDLYKVGLESGKKYDKDSLMHLIYRITHHVELGRAGAKIYFKDSLLHQAGVDREALPEICVGRDYSMFEPND
jgi:DNA repair photolyase